MSEEFKIQLVEPKNPALHTIASVNPFDEKDVDNSNFIKPLPWLNYSYHFSVSLKRQIIILIHKGRQIFSI